MHLTREELAAMMTQVAAALKLDLAYYQFDNDTPKAPPYLVWYLSVNNDVLADNTNYVDKEQLNVELYSDIRDFDLEKQLETELKARGVSYHKEAAYVDSEHFYQIAYESEVIING